MDGLGKTIEWSNIGGECELNHWESEFCAENLEGNESHQDKFLFLHSMFSRTMLT